MKEQCSVQSGSCETAVQDCGVGQAAQECCPIEAAARAWEGSFCQAMREVQTDLLKEKIRKAWGSQMDKAAEAVLQSAELKWQSMLLAGKSKMSLREKLESIWTEGKK